jgi:hypothetical protein
MIVPSSEIKPELIAVRVVRILQQLEMDSMDLLKETTGSHLTAAWAEMFDLLLE